MFEAQINIFSVPFHLPFFFPSTLKFHIRANVRSCVNSPAEEATLPIRNIIVLLFATRLASGFTRRPRRCRRSSGMQPTQTSTGALSPPGGVSGTVNFTTQSNVQSRPPTAARHCRADRSRHSVSNPLSWSFQHITRKPHL